MLYPAQGRGWLQQRKGPYVHLLQVMPLQWNYLKQCQQYRTLEQLNVMPCSTGGGLGFGPSVVGQSNSPPGPSPPTSPLAPPSPILLHSRGGTGQQKGDLILVPVTAAFP